MKLELPKRPLRILYHHRTQGRGAEGNHIVSVVTALRKLGHHVKVLSPSGIDPFTKDTSPVDKVSMNATGINALWRFVSRNFPNWLFELAEIFYNIPAYLRISRALTTEQFDLVYERYAFFLISGAIAANRHHVPFLLEANEVSGVPERARPQSFLKLCNVFERALFKRCTRIHTVSSNLAERAQLSGATIEQLLVVPNGFDMARIPNTLSRDELRRHYKIDGNFVLGFAGWFDDWDRLPDLVDVLNRVLLHDDKFRLCLIGDGRGRESAEQRAAQYGVSDKIIFTGAVNRSEVYNYLSMVDVGVLPNSNVFGSPMIMFEMMGLGIPLVLPRLPPIQDVHIHGLTALLFEPLNIDECVKCVLEMFTDEKLRERLSSASKRMLMEKHSWEHTVQTIIAS